LQSVDVRGVTYVTTGAGSETYAPGPVGREGFCSGAHGFMTCSLSAQKLDFALVDMTGAVLYSQSVMPS
jgi:acid phosphatase